MRLSAGFSKNGCYVAVELVFPTKKRTQQNNTETKQSGRSSMSFILNYKFQCIRLYKMQYDTVCFTLLTCISVKAVCRQFFITLELSFHPKMNLKHFRQNAFRTFDIVCELKCKTCATHNFYKYSEMQWLDKYYTRKYSPEHGAVC